MNGAPPKKGLIYDADCGFCTTSAEWLARGRDWKPVSWQSLPDLGSLGLTMEMVSTAAYWLEDGTVADEGPGAIAAALRTHRGWRGLTGRVIGARAVLPVAKVVYRWVAGNRHKMPGGTAACRVPRQ